MPAWKALSAVVAAIVTSAGVHTALAQSTDPAAVLRRYIDALNAGDLEAALSTWAENGVLTNTRGRRHVGHEKLRPFIRQNISRGIRQEPEAVQTTGDTVKWTNRETNESYKKLNVAPVQQNSEVVVRDGKIISWVNYFPMSEIARIEEACATPQALGVLLNDQPCGQFVEQATAQTAKMLGTGSSKTP